MTALFVISAVVILIALGLSSHGSQRAAAGLFVLWVLVLLCFLVVPPVLWLWVFGLSLVPAFLAARILKSRGAAVACLTITIAVCGMLGTACLHRYLELAALRDKYPPVAVSTRLAYEAKRQRRARAGDPAEQAVATFERQPPFDAVAQEVQRLEERLDDWSTARPRKFPRRGYALARLESLHRRMVFDFTLAEGFGAGRMFPRGIRREHIESSDAPATGSEEVPKTEPDDLPTTTGGAFPEMAEEEGHVLPERAALREAHEKGVLEFANREGFGFVSGRDKVYDFQPHGLQAAPEVPGPGGAPSPSSWGIARLELVSLLKHDAPAVYVAEELPRMAELLEVPARPLDAFESDALRQLRAGEELFVEEHGDEIRMLGSLRAAKQCIECHYVKRGELLGAFSYRLRRDVRGRPRPAPTNKPVL